MNGALLTLYFKVRSGRFFLIAVLIFCTCWLFFDWLDNFDPDYGLYNVILSTEASLNGTVIVMMAEGFEGYVRKVLGAVRALMDAQAMQLEQIKRLSEVVRVETDENQRLIEALHQSLAELRAR